MSYPKLIVPLAISISIQDRKANKSPINSLMVPLESSFHLATALILAPPATMIRMMINGRMNIKL